MTNDSFDRLMSRLNDLTEVSHAILITTADEGFRNLRARALCPDCAEQTPVYSDEVERIQVEVSPSETCDECSCEFGAKRDHEHIDPTGEYPVDPDCATERFIVG